MTEPGSSSERIDGQYEEGDSSFFGLASVILVNRRLIALWSFIGGAIAALSVVFKGLTWLASASFIPQAAEADSGLRSLAGQFGVAIPGGAASATESPDFYADLLNSRVILSPIVNDTLFVVEEGERRPVLELLKVSASDGAESHERGMEALRRLINTSIVRATGVLTVSVTTAWPSVSLAITEWLVEGVNRFNLQTRQSQAAEERRFVEGRLTTQQESLAEAEERLSTFLQANRQFANSPSLNFEFERLQRTVALQQQVLVGLTQAYEESRIREVRDVAVITLIESPVLPMRPDRRGRLFRGLLGILVGAIFGVFVALTRETYRRRLSEGDKEVARFAALVRETLVDLKPWSPRRPRGGASG